MYISKKGLLTCLSMALSMGFLTSCSSEDEDFDKDEEEVVDVQTQVWDFDGTRLNSVGSDGYYTHFNYTADGSLSQIVKEIGKVAFDFTTGIITYTNGFTEEKAHFTTNKKGYITEVNSTRSDEDGDWTTVYKFQYNSSDHLVSVSGKEVYTDHATKEKKTTDVTWEIKWNGDMLSSVSINGFDGVERWGGISNYKYTDAVDNRFMQYTESVVSDLDFDGGVEEFLYVGLLGKSSSKYPSRIEEDDMEDVYNITYELNSKGLVEKETQVSSGTYGDYTYTTDYTYQGLSKGSASAVDKNVGVDKKRHKINRNRISLFGMEKPQ